MKRTLFLFCLVVLFAITILSQEKNSPKSTGLALSDSLKILEPLLNREWTGTLKAPDGSAEFKVVRKFEALWDGKVIKCTKINRDLNNFGEGYIYWDDISKKIAIFFIESSGAFLNGFVMVENNVITFEGKMTWPAQANPQVKQSYDFKNTFEFISESEMVDRWFHNAFGPWRPGHVITFKVENEKAEIDQNK